MRRLALALAAILWAGVASAASVNVTFVVPSLGGIANTMVLRDQTGSGVTNYPLQIGRAFLQGAIADSPQIVLAGVPVTTQADVLNRYPDGSVKFAVLSAIVPAIPAGGTVAVSFQDQATGNNAPMTTAAMVAMLPGDATMTIASGASSTPVSLKAMLNGGFCRTRLAGPIAQTVSCADDSLAASFDIGFDGTHHPFRPRFYATFWPGISKVLVRYVGDGAKSTEVTDQTYTATLALNGATVYTLDLTGTQATHPKLHWALSSWTKEFWQGGAPPLQVDIDPNLAYMASTRFVANFDPSIQMQKDQISAYYATFTAAQNEPYDGGWDGGLYVEDMGGTGGRPELGPDPVYCGDWLYTGMWQMRDMCERMADLAASWPVHLRETAPGYRLSRLDGAGASTGLGREISITDRPAITSANTYLLLYRPSGTSNVTVIGPTATQPWIYEDSHMPEPNYLPYLMTGDPWYLDQLYAWVGFAALGSDGQATNYYAGRGPTGREGVINGETRGLGWVMRSRSEAAFIAPDSDPEKAYFTYLVNDAIARWEGAVDIEGTPFQTAPVIAGSHGTSYGTCATDCNLWTWAHIVGNHEAPFMPSTSVSPLHMWESYCNPTTTVPGNPCDASGYVGGIGSTFVTDVSSDDSPWMENYFRFGVLRARDLGFDIGPLASWLMVYNVGLILDSGNSTTTPSIPGAEMAALYRMPTALHSTGTWIQDWPTVFSSLWSDYRDGTPAGTAYVGGLPMYYQAQTGYNPATGVISIPPAPNSGASQYYANTFLAVTCMGADLNARGAAACAWLRAHMPTPYANGPGGNDPRWSFITRTDTNVLPAIPPQ